MGPKNTWKFFEIGIILLCLVAHLYVVLAPANSLMHWYSSDDAFYYFKVAANFTSGHGMTFDGINRTNGFQPLWLLVCLAIFWLAKYDPILPLRLLVLVSALLSAWAGIFLLRILRKYTSAVTAAAATIFWVFLPFIHTSIVQRGLESSLSAFMLALLIYLATLWRRTNSTPLQLAGLGLIAGLTILARLDNIFVVFLLGVWFALGFTTAYLRTIAVGDLGLIFIVGLLSYFVGFRTGISDLNNWASLPWLLGFGFLIKPILFYLFGLYTLKGALVSWKFLGRISLATALGEMLLAAILVILHHFGTFPKLSQPLLLLDLTGTWISTLALRLLAGRLFTTGTEAISMPIFSFKFWKGPFKRSIGYFVPPFLLLGAYGIWSQLYFGTPLPVSGEIKNWWGTIYIGLYGSVKNSALSNVFGNNAWALALSPTWSITGLMQAHAAIPFLPILIKTLSVGLLLALLISQRGWVIGLVDQLGLFTLFVGLYAQIFYYTSTPYWSANDWYWTSEMFFTVMCLGILLECVSRILQDLKVNSRVWQTCMAVLSGGVLILFGRMLWYEFPFHQSSTVQQSYLEADRMLEADTESGSLIGLTGGGELGYFIQGRTVINLDGLINSYEYFQSLRNGEGNRFLNALGMDYVIASDYMLTLAPYSKIFPGHILAYKPFGSAVLYRYVPFP